MPSPSNPDPLVLLTGVPRSGTTLSCELLNLLDDVCALDEPMDVGPMVVRATRADGAGLDGELICREISDFARSQRRSILERGAALTRHVDGRVSGSRIEDVRDHSGARVRLGEKGEIPILAPLRSDFKLVIKHPVLFAALLPKLVARFEVFAIVRNPVAVLGSWESVPMMVRDGQLGLPAALAPVLAQTLHDTPGLLARQLLLLEWYFRMIATSLPPERVIHYERIIASGGAALAPIAAPAATLGERLAGRNTAAVYDHPRMVQAGELLLDRDDPDWQRFYSPASVRELLESLADQRPDQPVLPADRNPADRTGPHSEAASSS